MTDFPTSGALLSSLNAEEQLRAFSLLMEHVTDYAIFLFDPEREVLFWNKGAELLEGYSQAEMQGQPADIIFTPEDRARHAPEEETRLARAEGRAEDERWHLRKDGTRFWGSGVVTALRDETGQLRWYIKILRDLTERHEAEAERERMAARLLAQQRQTILAEERERMAQELHDTLAQGLTSIKLQLDMVEELLFTEPNQARTYLNRAQTIARESLGETRRVVQGLRSRELEGRELPDALQYQAAQATRDSGIPVHIEVEGDVYPLPAHVETELFRIAQEAVTNALRHAHASQITLCLRYTEKEVRLLAQDDGHGFDPEVLTAGFGLKGMRERAERAGGQLQLESAAGKGVVIRVTVPTARLV